MGELSEYEILWNTAALTSLRRQQLMSLSKKYGLKANGKNSEMVARLHEFGASMTPASKKVLDFASVDAQEPSSPVPAIIRSSTPEDASMLSPQQTPTMAPGSDAIMGSPTPVRNGPAAMDVCSPNVNEDIELPSAPPSVAPKQVPMRKQPSTTTLGHGSDAWEVLTTGNASLIEEVQENDDSLGSGSTRSWKSAGNGTSLGKELPKSAGFLIRHVADSSEPYGELRPRVGSLRSLASSIRRTASRTLSARYKSDESVSPGPGVAFPDRAGGNDAPPANLEPEEEEEVLPGSPASAIGIAKRHTKHSSVSLHHRPSTIRMVSPGPSLALKLERAASPPPMESDDELPLTGRNSVNRIKQRNSIVMLEKDGAKDGPAPPPSAMKRQSLPFLLQRAGSNSNLTSKVYPDLPTSPMERVTTPSPTKSPLPGAFPGNPTSPSFIFGTGQKITGTQFSSAGLKLLEEMQAKMGGAGHFNKELLKGRQAEISKLVSVNAEIQTGTQGGFGLSGGQNIGYDRFEEAHKREFAKMQPLTAQSKPVSDTPNKRKLDISASVSAKVNGLPATAEDAEERTSKRTKMSAAPKYLGGLRNTLSTKRSDAAAVASPRKRKPETLRKFNFLRQKKTATRSESILSEGSYILPSVSVPDDSDARPKMSKMAKLRNVSGSSKAPAPQASSVTASAASSLSAKAPAPNTALARKAEGGGPSTIVSGANGQPYSRLPIPDFGPPVSIEALKGEPVSSSSLPRATTSASSKAESATVPRPKSIAIGGSAVPLARSGKTHELARAATDRTKATAPGFVPFHAAPARKASAPASVNASSSRSSTLFAPTAASRARMQATVKPPVGSPAVNGAWAPAHAPAHATGNARRPLPVPPQSPPGAPAGPSHVTSPFGEATPRTGHLFTSGFHLHPTADARSPGRPLPRPPARGASDLRSPARRFATSTPSKHGSVSARTRTAASGRAAVKLNTDDRSLPRRQADIRAKQDRILQERELRRMLG